MGDRLGFVDESGWPYPDEADDRRWAEPVDLRSDPDDDLVALHALAPRILGSLSNVERAAVTGRFGLDGEPPMSMHELAAALGLSAGRTRAALSSSLDKLRAALDEAPG